MRATVGHFSHAFYGELSKYCYVFILYMNWFIDCIKNNMYVFSHPQAEDPKLLKTHTLKIGSLVMKPSLSINIGSHSY